MIDVSSGSRKRVSSVICMSATPHCNKCLVVLCVLTDSFLVMVSGYLCKFTWWLIYLVQISVGYSGHGCMAQWLEQLTADQQVPWFNSGWKSWFTFMTCSDNPMNQISQMFISKSPITRNSVKKKSKKVKKKKRSKIPTRARKRHATRDTQCEQQVCRSPQHDCGTRVANTETGWRPNRLVAEQVHPQHGSGTCCESSSTW